MRGRKEIAILFFIIAVLIFYISNQKREKTHYKLPEVKKLQTDEISNINIKKKNSEIMLVKEAGKWLIGEKKYPADSTMVENMLKAISNIKLSALVSESKNYSIYDLDEENRVEVEAFKGDKLLRKIIIGKNAPTHHHTFVMLDDDYRVYHAEGTIRREFDRTVAELRDRKVMSFSDEISEVTLKRGKETLVMVKTSPPVSVDITETEAKEKEKTEESTPKWTTADGKAVKENEIKTIINTLSNLICDEFIEDKTKEDFKSPIFTATLKGINTYTISLFEKENGKYPAISSDSEYPFLLSEWKANRIMKDFKNLIEEEK
jgi:hypothetical protein